MTKSELVFELPSSHHAKTLHALNTTFQPYADTAYGTFLTWWNLYDDLSFGMLNGNVVVQSSYPTLGKKIAYTIVGGNEAVKTVMALFDWQKKHSLETVLHSMPEYQLATLKKYKNITVTHEPDISEYVLSTEQQATLRGKDFYMTRHKVNNFKNVHGESNIECREVDLTQSESKKMLTNSLFVWGGFSKNDEEKLEEQVINKTMQINDEVKLRCFGVFVKDKLVSFALYKILPRSYVNLNHLKVCHDYRNAFIYTLHSLSIYLFKQGVSSINIEQDLGIEGIRIFKQRLRPVEILNKYTVRLV